MEKNNLAELRTQIDEVDSQLIHLLANRFNLVKKIGVLKKENDIAPLDNKRWQEVIESRKQIAKSLKLSPKFINKIYNLIHIHSLKLENKLI